MAQRAVTGYGAKIRVSCATFSISETYYRYLATDVGADVSIKDLIELMQPYYWQRNGFAHTIMNA